MPSSSVTMFVMNNCDRDARVLKEAESLAATGHSVRVIAMLDATTAAHETRLGFAIDRVVKNPIHYRLLRRLGAGSREAATQPTRRRSPLVWRRIGQQLRSTLKRLGVDEQADIRLHIRVGVIGLLHAVFFPLRVLAMPGLVCRRLVARTLGMDARVRARAYVYIRIWSRVRRLRSRLLHTPRRLAARVVRSAFHLVHRPLCFLDYYVRAYRLAREAPTDIYHAHDLNTLPVAWWSRRRLGGKLIYDSHEIYTEISNLGRLGKRVTAAMERFFIRRCDAVITIHDTAASELARRYRVPVPSVVRNCPRIPPSCEKTQRLHDALGLQTGDLVILYQGGFAWGRGLSNLLRAVAYLPEHVKLVMMGWGKIEPELRKLAGELGLLDRQVFFFPPVPQAELLYWSAAADVGVIPYQAVSLNNYLCMPNKLFEYMGAGLPVVASGFPELSRVIDGSGAGTTFDPESPKSIADALLKVLGDKELRTRMAENARKASLIYNWENEEKSLLAVYERVAP